MKNNLFEEFKDILKPDEDIYNKIDGKTLKMYVIREGDITIVGGKDVKSGVIYILDMINKKEERK